MNFGSGGGWPKAINDAWYLLPKQLDAGFDIIDGANLDINSHSDDLIFDPVNLSFTTVFKDEIPKIKPINILNTGNMTLQVNCRLVSDNFIMGLSDSVLENENLTLTLNPGRMKTLYIQFIADTVGVTSTDLILSYSDLPVVQTLPIIGTVIPNIGTAVNHRYVSGKWEKSQSPFFVCTDIEIEKGKTLIIEPGTDIRFLGPYSFNIPKDTRLVAEGTTEDSILFQAALGHTWSGFNFLSSGYDDLLSYCLISGIGRNLNTNGIYIWQSYPVFNNVKILKNVSSGSLLRLKKSAARFYNVSIINNYTLTNSIMQIDGYFPNRTYDSDNFSQTSRSPELRNTLITGNSSGNYTISVNNSSPSFINSIISCNKSDTKDGPAGALNVSATDSHLSFINSILAPNETHSGPVLVSESSTGYLTFSYSNVDTNDISWANAKRNMNGLNWGVGNITTDPLFTNAVENDFTLKTGSPCIDAGNPSQEYSDPVNPEKPGYALWPAMGTGRNDMGIYGGGMVSTNKPDNQADQFYLHQNYPNPFNSETTIEFSLPEKRDVSIIIYNTLGQKVKSFYYPEVFKGTYKIRWDGRDMHGVPVGSGLYFYILKSRTHIETRKLIILK
ncbi:MAG: T9SS type A sorting domain-containing protein [Calditrichaceae bacterium]